MVRDKNLAKVIFSATPCLEWVLLDGAVRAEKKFRKKVDFSEKYLDKFI